MEFLDKNISFSISSENEEIYNILIEASKGMISSSELFALCLAIGYKENRKIELKDKSQNKKINLSNIRAEYGPLIYMALLKDRDLNISYADLSEEMKFKDYKNTLEGYSEGGMKILREYALSPNIIKDGKVREDYVFDIYIYILSELRREI